MPLQTDKDNNGWFYRWGDSGKKYYFRLANGRSKSIAKGKAEKQGRAIERSIAERKSK